MTHKLLNLFCDGWENIVLIANNKVVSIVFEEKEKVVSTVVYMKIKQLIPNVVKNITSVALFIGNY